MTIETEFAAPVLPASRPASVREVLVQFVVNPYRSIIARWNWKSAVFSALIRANIFFFVTLRSGFHAALGAFSAELLYRVLTSGFFGAMTQSLSAAEPAWAGAIAVSIVLPLSSHSIEFLIHSMRHTPHLKANILTSIGFTVISTLFNFHAMRKGSLIVGDGGQSVGGDFRSMPRLIGSFLAAGPIALWQCLRILLSSIALRPTLRPATPVPGHYIASSLHESEDAASD